MFPYFSYLSAACTRNGSLLISLIVVQLAASGCAIHPLPEDFAGVTTYTIVRQIRCETRAAILNSLVGWLNHDVKVGPKSRLVGERLLANPLSIRTFSTHQLDSRDAKIASLFWTAGIAYNYNLEMTETNDFDAEINLLKPFGANMFTADLKGGMDRSRQNTRTFTITDTFSGLLHDTPPEYCDGKVVGEDYLYPIAGHIGIEPMIQEFVRLTLFGNLAGSEDDPAGPPTMVDALEFQTVISGSAAPKVTFSPVGKGLSVTDATVTAAGSRTDLHKLTIGLAIAKGDLGEVSPLRTTLFGRLLTASGSGTRKVAAEAVDQVLTQKALNQTVIVQH